ncbi:MAG: potassium channel family protein [Anaerovoracaceae bacterium]|jgi:trk system potassium uptake protein TrkA
MGVLNKKEQPAYTIIVGCGRLGASIANTLSDAGENVMIIDRNQDSFRKLSPSFGGLAIKGDATEISVLKEAEIQKATSVIAVTNIDNTNIMIAQMAKETFQIKNVIARLYDPDRECVYREFNIDTICPSVLSAQAVDRLLHGGGNCADGMVREARDEGFREER